MSRAKGKVQSFEPANVSGLDTRIWQGRGTSSDIDGVVFSLQGEIVKEFGARKLLEWASVPVDPALYHHADPTLPGTEVIAVEPNPLLGNEVLELGTFVWDTTTELLVAYYKPFAEIGGAAPSPHGHSNDLSPGGDVVISVLETNKLRTLYSYKVAFGKPHPRYYPRFVDVGPYVVITVEGMRPVKWDGRFVSFVGIYEQPTSPEAAAILGYGDNLDPTKDSHATPSLSGDFWNEHCFDQDDATGVTVEYYQTYINKYGQESNISPASNSLKLSDLLQVDEARSIQNTIASTLASSGGPETQPLATTGATQPAPTVGVMNSALSSDYAISSSANSAASVRNASSKDKRLVAFLNLGEAPRQTDIVERALYRGIGGQAPTALPRLLGAAANTHFDVRRLGESAVDPAPQRGENDPPPPSRWSFPFRSRVYYRGDKATLHYSKINFPEAVSATNFVEINTNDGDQITAWGTAQDYAIVFKRNSAYLLTHDKNEEPIVTPLQSTFGAITDRAVISFDNKTYFLSDVGFHMFDGSSFKRISSVLDQKVRQLPMHTREAATVFYDKNDSRIYIAVNGNPGAENNQVWAVHTETGSFSVIKNRKIQAATVLKNEVIVGMPQDSDGECNLFMWGVGYDIDGTSYDGSFSTEWIELKVPHSDKRFYKLLLYFVQTGDITMDVSWYLDWDDSSAAGSTTVSMKSDDAVVWDTTATWATSVLWDGRRLVSRFVDLPEVNATSSAEQDVTGKSIRFMFKTPSSTDTSGNPTPFRLVGWQIIADDYGERAEGSAAR